MKLAIFDIDGTLTATNGVDDECFVQAFADAHAVRGLSQNWAEYPHTTDSGITEHIFQTRLGRAPRGEDIACLQRQFFALLKQRCETERTRFAEIAGARLAFERVRQETDWATAIATGCWRESALLKLAMVGIDTSDVPSAFAEDGLSREEILLAAIARAKEHCGQEEFEKIVSIGDGLWDVRAAVRLKLPFLGVASCEREELLRQAGATHVIEDFTDYRRVLQALEDAAAPIAI